MRLVRAATVLAGLLVAAWLVREVGLDALVAELRELSWRLLPLMIPQGLVSVLDAAGWRYAFPGALPPLTPLVTMRLAGEAVGDTIPSGTLGGDALKAWLAERAGIPIREGLVSVVVAKTVLVGSQVAFLSVGLGLAAAIAVTPALQSTLAALTGLGLVASAGFVWAQHRGLFRAGGRAIGWLGLGSRAATTAARLDGDLRTYYRTQPGRLGTAFLLHLLGWMAGAIEVWLTLRFLDAPVPFTIALVIEAAVTGIRSAGFLVPGALGIQEGGLIGIFTALGLGTHTGLALGVVRRVREVAWTIAGYACLAGWRGERGAVPESGA